MGRGTDRIRQAIIKDKLTGSKNLHLISVRIEKDLQENLPFQTLACCSALPIQPHD
jgi:hypothetical protein